jgi:formate hydrogenlyase transcriptional activator
MKYLLLQQVRIPSGGEPQWRNTMRSEQVNGEIVGQSRVLKQATQQVETVAPTDATVLLLGETGTGKELFARAVHHLSSRRNQPFVRANCAAIPAGLLESELFGHERGAFTGAVTRNIGRIELANRGTLFLDEIGDIPLELQSKLLRILQEREFERLGSSQTIRVDFRLVAATNRNLAEMVANGQFRQDLYYRLSVFPIQIPPLRDRREDIPMLVRYYVKMYAQKMNKQVENIVPEDIEALVHHSWPGNVRELQNIVERSIVVFGDGVLAISCPGEPRRTINAEWKRTTSKSTQARLEQRLPVLLLSRMGCPAAQALFEDYTQAAIEHFEAADTLSNLVGQHGLFEEQKASVERAHEKCSAARLALEQHWAQHNCR